jgi:mRNA-decapping enzyme subunit 2
MSEQGPNRETFLKRQQQRRNKKNALKNQTLPNNSTNLGFADVMDDLTIRFIMNCPEEEFESFDRLFFQIEEAHWFYEDFYREHNKSLPSLNFRQFVDKMFEHCPVLSPFREAIEKYIQSFYEYKTTVPVYGAIILNQTRDKVLLVKGWTSKSWTFPRGKINQDEAELVCAAREVKEEIGFDLTPYLHADHFVHHTFNEQSVKLYIVTGIPESTNFAPQTRKEIRAIEWHAIDSIMSARSPANPKKSANKYWTISAFIPKLKQWLVKNSNNNKMNNNNRNNKRKLSPKPESLAPSDDTSPTNHRNQKRGRRGGRKSPTSEAPAQQRERSSSAPVQPEIIRPARKLSFGNEVQNVETLQSNNHPVILKRQEPVPVSSSYGMPIPLSSSPPQMQYPYPYAHSYPSPYTNYVQQPYPYQLYAYGAAMMSNDASITSVVV